jgi:hypothetical protein
MGTTEKPQQLLQQPQATSSYQQGYPASLGPQQIFREHAVRHYIQRSEQSVLPKTISPFVFMLCWLGLALTILISFLIWSVPLPNYVDTLGIPIPPHSAANTSATNTFLVFFPRGAQAYVQQGQTVKLNINSVSSPLTARITQFKTQPLQADAIKQRYGLNPNILQPFPPDGVLVGIVTTPQMISLQSLMGGRVIIRYQSGTIKALSLLLGM